MNGINLKMKKRTLNLINRLKASGTTFTCSTFFLLERTDIYDENEIIFALKKFTDKSDDFTKFVIYL